MKLDTRSWLYRHLQDRAHEALGRLAVEHQCFEQMPSTATVWYPELAHQLCNDNTSEASLNHRFYSVVYKTAKNLRVQPSEIDDLVIHAISLELLTLPGFLDKVLTAYGKYSISKEQVPSSIRPQRISRNSVQWVSSERSIVNLVAHLAVLRVIDTLTNFDQPGVNDLVHEYLQHPNAENDFTVDDIANAKLVLATEWVNNVTKDQYLALAKAKRNEKSGRATFFLSMSGDDRGVTGSENGLVRWAFGGLPLLAATGPALATIPNFSYDEKLEAVLGSWDRAVWGGDETVLRPEKMWLDFNEALFGVVSELDDFATQHDPVVVGDIGELVQKSHQTRER